MLYLLDPILVEKPWGIDPDRFAHLVGVDVPFTDTVGELWTASAMTDLDNRTNTVRPGDSGTTLSELARNLGQDLLGPVVTDEVMNAPRGKTEAWTIRHVRGDIVILGGLDPSMTRERFEQLVDDGFFERELTLDDLTDHGILPHTPRVGQTWLSRPGTVHAVWPVSDDAELVFDEIQQGFGSNPVPTLSKVLSIGKSNLSLQVHPSDDDVADEDDPELKRKYLEEPTLRISDFGGGRPIQPGWARKVIRYGHTTFSTCNPLTVKLADGISSTVVVACGQFVREIVDVDPGTHTLVRPDRHYDVMHVVAGSGTLGSGDQSLKLHAGVTVMRPAPDTELTVTTAAPLRLVTDYYDDLGQLVDQLLETGAAKPEIVALAGTEYGNEFIELLGR